ncbi:MAG TPA: SDR family NAD(P)-dependent oxidoreductase [Acidimicrobiales bacterium]|nr:SDR family NAD(P)-dependent oxidoreductase [Acidimicrobiales bacterium]
MDHLRDRVAVITGGASGIGLATARRLAAEGMHLVLADIESGPLQEAVDGLTAAGASAIGVVTDVSDAASMDALGAAALDRFDRVHLVFNNAGVSGGGGPVHQLTTADWTWTLGVNLWGVIHGHRVFQAHLMEHGDGHIVNTASIAGHTSFPGMAPYNVTKHSVVTLSETVYQELLAEGSTVGISVLCPGFVNTRIMESDRNRPEALARTLDVDDEEREAFRAMARDFFAAQKSPDEVAGLIVDAVRARRLYVFTDEVFTGHVAERHADIAARRNPRPMSNLIEESLGMRPDAG